MDQQATSYRVELYRLGFIGRGETSPYRLIQALLRARASDADALERWRRSVEVLDKSFRPW